MTGREVKNVEGGKRLIKAFTEFYNRSDDSSWTRVIIEVKKNLVERIDRTCNLLNSEA